jgi:hypothetical protein
MVVISCRVWTKNEVTYEKGYVNSHSETKGYVNLKNIQKYCFLKTDVTLFFKFHKFIYHDISMPPMF